jgi:hypothetical protein
MRVANVIHPGCPPLTGTTVNYAGILKDVEEDVAHFDHTTIIGTPSLLMDVRTVTVQRSADGMLGFQFYSEVGLPWTRVCDIVPGSPCASTKLQQEDVIIEIDKIEVLNAGHGACSLYHGFRLQP